MSKPRIRYGILDDEGQVIRWVWNKPSALYRYIIQRVPTVDLSNIEDAPF